MSNVANEIKVSLYEYEVLTANQLAIIHSLNKNTVYNCLSQMNKDFEIKKIDVPEIGRGCKAYFPSAKTAKFAAESRNEGHLFREKDWEDVPGSYLNILITNQFFCQLISATKETTGTGIREWLGRRSLAQRYSLQEPDESLKKSKKDQLPWAKMNGYCELYYNEIKKYLHVDVYSGNETIPVMQDKLSSHYQALRAYWNYDSHKVLLLFVYLGRQTGEKLMKIWKLLTRGDNMAPFAAAANFEVLATKGILAPLWRTSTGEEEKVSIMDMPSVTVEKMADEELIGKQKRIIFAFKVIEGFSGSTDTQREQNSTNDIKKDDNQHKSSTDEKSDITKINKEGSSEISNLGVGEDDEISQQSEMENEGKDKVANADGSLTPNGKEGGGGSSIALSWDSN